MKLNQYNTLWALTASLLTGASALAISHIPAHATSYAIQDGGNIHALTPATPASGDLWELRGNAYVSDGASTLFAKKVPSALTIGGVSGGSTVTMNDGLGHYAYFSATGATTVRLSNVTFSGGGNATSGGVFDSSGGLTLNTVGTVAFNNNNSAIRALAAVTVNGSLSASGNTTAIAGTGGSVIFARNGGVTITDSVNLSSNRTTGNGGAIWAADTNAGVSLGNSGSTVSLTDNKAGYNADETTASAKVQGGAIFAARTVSISGSTIKITDNWANSGGGAIASLNGGNITIGDNRSSVTIDNNRSGYNNNGTYANGGGGGAIWTGPTGSVAVSGASISLSGNWATYDGGAISSGGAVSMGSAGGSVTIAGNRTGYKFDGASANAAAKGGAISTAATVTLSGQTITVSDNMATYMGGGIYAFDGVSMGAPGSTVTISGNQSGYDAAGMAVKDSSQGGGIWSSGPVTLTGASITLSGNYTAGYDGGGIFTTKTVSIGDSGSTLTIKDNVAGYNLAGQVTGNYATGGAISSGGTTTLTGSAITLSGNKATDSGGGIFSWENVVVNGPLSARDNRSGLAGGAIYADGDVIVNGDAELGDNTAAGSAGGFYAGGNVTVAGNLAANANKAGGNGGVIRTPGSVSVGGDAALTDNTAGLNGGAIHAGGGMTLTSAATINGNRAAGNGGALWSAGNITLNAASTGTIASANRAGGSGGAIYLNSAVLTLNAISGDIVFSGNMQNTAGAPRANAAYIDTTGGGDSGVLLNAAAGRRIVFYDPVQSNAANGLVTVTKEGPGTVSFDGMNYVDSADRWSQVFADTTVSAGTFEVANNAVYGALSTDAATPAAATSFTLAAGAMVQGGLVGTIRADNVAFNGNLSIAGRHAPITEYSIFNMIANGATFGGGVIYFNTFLNDGLTQQSDLLVLNLNGATASGQALLHVTAVPGSPGAYTPGEGIMLIRTDSGTTPDGTFTLGNRVAAGAYDYFLRRGGRDGDPQNANNWYLRNEAAPIPPDPDPGPAPVPTPRPEIPTNAVILPLALQYGYAMLDTLHERIGETWTSPLAPVTEERMVWCKDPSVNSRCTVRVPVASANGANTDETRWARSGWARLIGNRGLHQPDNYWRSGPNYDYTFGGFQAGLDIYAREQSDGTLDKAGIYVGYGQIDASVRGLAGAYYGPKAGTVSMDAYTLGGYWTHFSPDGWYTDAVIQGTWYTNTRAKSVLNETLKPDGFGVLGSLEAGYSFKLGSGWTLEPQVQIVYQNVTFEDARDSFGNFRFQDGDSLRGRLGMRLTKTWNTAEEGRQPQLITGWLRANVWREFLGDTRTAVAGFRGENPVITPSSLKGTWGEIGAGVTAQVSERISLFATGAYQQSLDHKGSRSWDGRLGMNIRW